MVEAEEGRGDGGGGRTVFLFEHFREGMRAEDLLVRSGFHTHSGAPPPHVRTGCDLAVSVPTEEMADAEKMLGEGGIAVWDVILRFGGDLPELQLSYLTKVVDYGEYVMVRVGNMKLTYRKETGVVVNVSGGGCPDIPLLAVEMVGSRLDEATSPAQLGFTLCAYTLQKAYEVALKRWRGGGTS